MFSGEQGTRQSGYEEPLGRLNKLAFKEIFESEDTLFRKKIGFAFKKDCKRDISKRCLNEVKKKKILAKELRG